MRVAAKRDDRSSQVKMSKNIRESAVSNVADGGGEFHDYFWPEKFELIGDGEGIHWPGLDEDISVEGLLAGKRSAESDASLARWIEKRKG